jgi:urease accessory protein
MPAGVVRVSGAALGGAPGHATLAFERSGPRTVLRTAYAVSPLRLLTPDNHGEAAWVFLSSFGGGLVDGDHVDIELDVQQRASALLGTQASTKVYRSPGGCGSRLGARVAEGATLTVIPDPVVCFAGARYTQRIDVDLAAGASLFLLDGYTCGRSARGERWEFDAYASRTTVTRGGAPVAIDATRLEKAPLPGLAEGSIGGHMGRYDAVLSLLVFGPRFEGVRARMLAAPGTHGGQGGGNGGGNGGGTGAVGKALVTASPVGADGAILRVFAERFESASRVLRTSFTELAALLGDDPTARKW